MKRGRLTKREIANLEKWREMISKQPGMAAAHAAWLSEEFAVLRSEVLHRVFMLQESFDRIEKLLVRRNRRAEEKHAR